MNDILPPRRQIPRLSRPQPRPQQPAVPAAPVSPVPPIKTPTPQPEMTLPTPAAAQPLPQPVQPPQPEQSSEPPAQSSPRRRVPRWVWWVGGVIVLIIAAAVAAFAYYQYELQPVSRTARTTTRVTITPNTSPSQIAQQLQDKQLIRSTTIFAVYTRLTGTRNKLQAGTYNLSPAMSLPTIVDHLAAGKTDTMRITFVPGAALWPDPRIAEKKRTDVETTLIDAGFQKADVDAALTKQYTHPLMAGRPQGSDIEGYVYGESYDFNADATLDDIFNKVFDTYYEALQKNDIIPALQQQGLSVYQGITLASIVQTEMGATDPSTASHDQQQVAQVFLARLAKGIPLGSDVTAYYGAIKAGQQPSVAVDTPYNTRLHAGLPPGPIATPSIGALEAVAHPAPGDYLFFLSGDDNVMYYAHTDAEHQANIKAHCQVKCAVS